MKWLLSLLLYPRREARDVRHPYIRALVKLRMKLDRLDVVLVEPQQRVVVQRQLLRKVEEGLAFSCEHDERRVAAPHAHEVPPDERVIIFAEGLCLPPA